MQSRVTTAGQIKMLPEASDESTRKETLGIARRHKAKVSIAL